MIRCPARECLEAQVTCPRPTEGRGEEQEFPNRRTVGPRAHSTALGFVRHSRVRRWERGRGHRVSDEPPKYTSSTDLSSRVSGLNGHWNDEWSPQLQDERFSKAMALTGAEFLDCVNYFGKVRQLSRTLLTRRRRKALLRGSLCDGGTEH